MKTSDIKKYPNRPVIHNHYPHLTWVVVDIFGYDEVRVELIEGKDPSFILGETCNCDIRNLEFKKINSNKDATILLERRC